MDSLQRDRFEMLSAYLDGEVTATERKQVQQWLETSPEVQHQYARLVRLRQGLQTLPMPPVEQSDQQMVKRVFNRLNQLRNRRCAAWGGAAIAAMFIGILSGVIPTTQSPAPQLAESPKQEAAEPLMIAFNEPVVRIPKAAIAPPEKFIKSSVGKSGANANKSPDFSNPKNLNK